MRRAAAAVDAEVRVVGPAAVRAVPVALATVRRAAIRIVRNVLIVRRPNKSQ